MLIIRNDTVRSVIQGLTGTKTALISFVNTYLHRILAATALIGVYIPIEGKFITAHRG